MRWSTNADARAIAAAVAASLVLLACIVGLAAAAGQTTVGVNLEQDTVDVGETTTTRVVVDTVQGGVGAGEFRVTIDDPTVATITDATVRGSGSQNVNIAGDGSFADFEYAFRDTADTGSVTIVEVTVEGTADGTTDISLRPSEGNDAVLLFDEDGANYDITRTTGATLAVGDTDSSPGQADTGGSRSADSGVDAEATETQTTATTTIAEPTRSPTSSAAQTVTTTESGLPTTEPTIAPVTAGPDRSTSADSAAREPSPVAESESGLSGTQVATGLLLLVATASICGYIYRR